MKSMFKHIRVPSSLLTALAMLTLAFGSLAFIPAAEAQSVNWKRLSPTTSPSARSDSAMAYDPVSKQVVLFGGWDGKSHLGETWTFDGSTWTQQKPSVAPS